MAKLKFGHRYIRKRESNPRHMQRITSSTGRAHFSLRPAPPWEWALPLRDCCQTVLSGWSTPRTKSSASYISIRKATRHQLFRSFLLLKISCAVALASQSLSKCSSVWGPFPDRLVRVDHRRLLVRWKISSSSKCASMMKRQRISYINCSLTLATGSVHVPSSAAVHPLDGHSEVVLSVNWSKMLTNRSF